jgi:hypothetical protein
MAGGDEFAFTRGDGAALLFLASSTYAMDAFSALNSSPWTAETFSAGDPEREKACKEYVYHAIGFCAVYALASAALAKSLWPIIGMSVTLGYMYWLYMRALKRGAQRENSEWD